MEELLEQLRDVKIQIDDIDFFFSSPANPFGDTEDLDELDEKRIELIKTKEGLEKQIDEKAKHLLGEYLSAPVYAQCYDGVCLKMSDIAEMYGVRTSPLFVLEIFDETKKIVEETLNSTQPHFEITNSIADLRKKHSGVTSSSYHTTYDQEFLNVKAVLIEMAYLIVLWDLMPSKSKLVIKSFSNARTICEKYDDFLKCMHNPLWDLVCERIECNDGRQRGEDYKIECRKLEKRIKELEEHKLPVHQEEDNNPGPIICDPHDKVRLEIVTRLLEESGAEFEKHGNKAEAARMLELITGLPFQTCKNYMTNRDLNTTEHSDEVLKANTSLKKLGINWQL